MSEGVYKITEMFEQSLCEYTGAPYAVTFDSCSSALFTALSYLKLNGEFIRIPSHTYMSVPCAVKQAGGRVQFVESSPILVGAYRLLPTNIIDSALRFTADMYEFGTETCLSFTGPFKHLKLSKAGAILTDSPCKAEWYRKFRFNGRNECSYHTDNFTMLGWNFYLLPEIAARGVLLMRQFYNLDGTKKHMQDIALPYPDLSKFEVYTT